MDPILGYWVEGKSVLYFVRGAFEALPEHKQAFNKAMPGVTVTPVTRHIDIAPYVVLRDKDKKISPDVFYTKWSPMSPVPLEHDHDGKNRFEVLDFAETKSEAESICQQLRK